MLQKRKRDNDEEDQDVSDSNNNNGNNNNGDDNTGNESNENKYSTIEKKVKISKVNKKFDNVMIQSSPLERPAILGRVSNSKSVRFSSPAGNSPHMSSYKIISSRVASPNSLICASALSLLSRRGISPKSLKHDSECLSSTSMTDRIKSSASTSLSSPISSKIITSTPRGITFVPNTPEFKPLPSVHLLTNNNNNNHNNNNNNNKSNNNNHIQESPFTCKSAIHLYNESSDQSDYINYACPSISQITLPECLLSNDIGNWTRPVVDVQGLISKNSDSVSSFN